MNELLAADKRSRPVLDLLAAQISLLGNKRAASIGNRSTAGSHRRRKRNRKLFKRQKGLFVVAGPERPIANVFDELRAEFNIRPDDIGATSPEVLAVQSHCGSACT